MPKHARSWNLPSLLLLLTGVIGGAALAVFNRVSPANPPGPAAPALSAALPFVVAGLLGVAKTTTA